MADPKDSGKDKDSVIIAPDTEGVRKSAGITGVLKGLSKILVLLVIVGLYKSCVGQNYAKQMTEKQAAVAKAPAGPTEVNEETRVEYYDLTSEFGPNLFLHGKPGEKVRFAAMGAAVEFHGLTDVGEFDIWQWPIGTPGYKEVSVTAFDLRARIAAKQPACLVMSDRPVIRVSYTVKVTRPLGT